VAELRRGLVIAEIELRVTPILQMVANAVDGFSQLTPEQDRS
jgi:hypothetical protein